MIKKCSQCDSPADKFWGLHKMCYFHYRINRMRNEAQQAGKFKPTREALEIELQKLVDMKCPKCDEIMVLHPELGTLRSVATLQHWSDGSISILCHSCNSRHGSVGDELFALLSADTKFCSGCKQVLPLEEFPKGNQYKGKGHHCFPCGRKKCMEYYWKSRKSSRERRRD